MIFRYLFVLFFSVTLAGMNNLYSQEYGDFELEAPPVDLPKRPIYDSVYFENEIPPYDIKRINRDKYLKDEKFKYKKRDDLGNIEYKNPFRLWLEELFKDMDGRPVDSVFDFIKWFLIGIFLILLFYFIYSNGYIKFGKRNKNLTKEQGITWGEISLDSDIIKKKIQELIAQGNYNEAFRLNYIRILKLLEKHKLIKIRPEKTNYDYLSELKSSDLKNSFNSLTILFDYIVYGAFNIGNEQYKRGESFINKIEKIIGD